MLSFITKVVLQVVLSVSLSTVMGSTSYAIEIVKNHDEEILNRPCILFVESSHIKENSSYLVALKIETRKVRLSWRWVIPTQVKTCSESSPTRMLVMNSAHAVLIGLSPNPYIYQLQVKPTEVSDEEVERLAHAVIKTLSDLQDVSDESPTPLLDDTDQIDIKQRDDRLTQPQVESSSTKPQSLWSAQVGGQYLSQININRAISGPTLELNFAPPSLPLSLSLVGAYLLSPELNQDGILSTLMLMEMLFMLKHNVHLTSAVLSFGVGGGGQRRTVTANSTGQRLNDIIYTSNVTTLTAQLEGAWRFTHRWHLGAQIGGVLYLGGTSYQWLTHEVYNATPAALSVKFMIGVNL